MIYINYNFQSIDFSLYSRYKPKIKIKMNSREVLKRDKFSLKLRKIKGINKVISISKIKKIRLIVKNWILRGIRFNERGSNPHSKGEDFSRSWKVFFEIIKFNKINKSEIIIFNIIMMNKDIIYIKN